MTLQCGFDFRVSLPLNNILETMNFLKNLFSQFPILYGIYLKRHHYAQGTHKKNLTDCNLKFI